MADQVAGMISRENVLGVGISAVDMAAAVDVIGRWIDDGRKEYVCVTGVHGVMESQRSAALRHIHNRAGMVTPDGMPMAWLLKMGGHRSSDRVCGPELMPAVFVASQARGDRHFLYGATPATLERLTARLRELAPAAQVVGTYSPPFRPLTESDSAAVVATINRAAPDIVWVGLSTPKQEYWMAAHRARLDAPVLIGVGAAFDVTAGVQPRAPRLLRRSGFEWTYRLVREPRRLLRRYLAIIPGFCIRVAMQKTGLFRPSLANGLATGEMQDAV